MNITKRDFTEGLVLAVGFAGFGPAIVQAADVAAADARAIAKEAYVYGFPMVDSCRIQHANFVDTPRTETLSAAGHQPRA